MPEIGNRASRVILYGDPNEFGLVLVPANAGSGSIGLILPIEPFVSQPSPARRPRRDRRGARGRDSDSEHFAMPAHD
jgi:hypothetical protein